MKRFLILAPFASIILGSCTTLSMKTATTKEVQVSVTSDLEIAQRKIRYKYVFDNSDYKLSRAKENAISEALKINGDADILVSPQYEVSILDSQTEIIVSGFPAKYKNLRSISTDGTVFRTTKDSLTEGCVISIPTEKPKLAISVKEEEKKETTYNVSEDTLNHLKKKAEANDAKAQYELGCYYWLDLGLTSTGKKWLKKAAERGYQPAIEKLNELNQCW